MIAAKIVQLHRAQQECCMDFDVKSLQHAYKGRFCICTWQIQLQQFQLAVGYQPATQNGENVWEASVSRLNSVNPEQNSMMVGIISIMSNSLKTPGGLQLAMAAGQQASIYGCSNHHDSCMVFTLKGDKWGSNIHHDACSTHIVCGIVSTKILSPIQSQKFRHKGILSVIQVASNLRSCKSLSNKN